MGETDIDFSMDTTLVEGDVDSWLEVTYSKTLSIFHGTVVFTIIIVMVLLINLG